MTWEADLRRAQRVNMVNDTFAGWRLRDVDRWWRRFPFQFDGRSHFITSVGACIDRGYGACGDAAASIAAHARLEGAKRVELCVEEPEEIDGKHVRVFVDGIGYDPYARYRPSWLPETCERRLRL